MLVSPPHADREQQPFGPRKVPGRTRPALSREPLSLCGGDVVGSFFHSIPSPICGYVISTPRRVAPGLWFPPHLPFGVSGHLRSPRGGVERRQALVRIRR